MQLQLAAAKLAEQCEAPPVCQHREVTPELFSHKKKLIVFQWFHSCRAREALGFLCSYKTSGTMLMSILHCHWMCDALQSSWCKTATQLPLSTWWQSPHFASPGTFVLVAEWG